MSWPDPIPMSPPRPLDAETRARIRGSRLARLVLSAPLIFTLLLMTIALLETWWWGAVMFAAFASPWVAFAMRNYLMSARISKIWRDGTLVDFTIIESAVAWSSYRGQTHAIRLRVGPHTAEFIGSRPRSTGLTGPALVSGRRALVWLDKNDGDDFELVHLTSA
jgi:hypothetical protein